jgi:hypothetical protein
MQKAKCKVQSAKWASLLALGDHRPSTIDHRPSRMIAAQHDSVYFAIVDGAQKQEAGIYLLEFSFSKPK